MKVDMKDPLGNVNPPSPFRSPAFGTMLDALAQAGLDGVDFFALEASANNHKPTNNRAKVKAGRKARLKNQRLSK